MEYYPTRMYPYPTLRHLMTEKAKFYSRFKEEIPDYFDNIKVEFLAKVGKMVDMKISINGKKKITIPLSSCEKPITGIFDWLETITYSQNETIEYDKFVTVGAAYQLLLHYESLNPQEDNLGFFFFYGEWTVGKDSKDKNASAFCLKKCLVEAFYKSFINFIELQIEKNKYAKHLASKRKIFPEWEYPFLDSETPEELRIKYKRPVLEAYIRTH